MFINNIDRECLEKLKKNHSLVIILEYGIVNDGFGQKVSSYIELSNIKVKK